MWNSDLKFPEGRKRPTARQWAQLEVCVCLSSHAVSLRSSLSSAIQGSLSVELIGKLDDGSQENLGSVRVVPPSLGFLYFLKQELCFRSDYRSVD
jgi:hypothetical protein